MYNLFKSQVIGGNFKMNIKTLKKNGSLVISLLGELDESVAEYTRKNIDKIILSERFDNVVFDMSGLTFMDSTGIGVLLGRYKLIKKLGGVAQISGSNKQIDRVLTMSGLYTIMEKIS